MKSHGNMKELIYVHLNTAHQYTVSYGVEFHEFVRSLPRELNNLVLLKHGYNESGFNMHTRFEYVEAEDVSKLLKENIAEYGSFCWIDFEDTDGLNELDGQEIAELLYLGHSKDHLRRPFYSKLNNRFVYLSQDDEWFNKTYYRNTSDFYHMLGRAMTLKLGRVTVMESIWPSIGRMSTVGSSKPVGRIICSTILGVCSNSYGPGVAETNTA